MKGVILAGGLGTRLYPLTKITNKHLLPVYDKPMILYPLETLKKSGITEIMIVVGREHAGDFMNFLGSGREYGVSLSYALQDKDDAGIPDALGYAEDFADNHGIAVFLGDNIFSDSFRADVNNYKGGCKVFIKKVPNVEQFGVPVFDKNKKIVRIEEKPKKPKSDYALTGAYFMDSRAFNIIKKLKPSSRGELEVTDIINWYIDKKELSYSVLKGTWMDAGTLDSLLEAARWAKNIHRSNKNHHLLYESNKRYN